jgi:integrase
MFYRDVDGNLAGEAFNYRDALRPLLRLYSRSIAAEFGPLALKTVRAEMIRLGWCRTYINRQTLRIKSVFRWGVENELLEPRVYEALRSVAGLRAGRSDARESQKIKPVAESHAQAIFSFLSPQVQAMVELQALTGMRPAEVCSMRGCDIDTTGKPWNYRPASHKTAHRGHERVIDLGPQARSIVERFLKLEPTAYLFQPAEAVAIRRRLRHEQRKTPMNQGNRPGKNRINRPRRAPGQRYEVAAYRRAMQRACERAFPPPTELARGTTHVRRGSTIATRPETRREWLTRLTADQRRALSAWWKAHRFHPHQLRHTAATRWRSLYGAEATLVLLGDRTTRMVDVYAEKDRMTASRIAEKIG